VYVTVIERADSRRKAEAVAAPRTSFARNDAAPVRVDPRSLVGARGEVLAMTTIHVTAGPAAGPIPVAVIAVEGRRHLARLDPAGGPRPPAPTQQRGAPA